MASYDSVHSGEALIEEVFIPRITGPLTRSSLVTIADLCCRAGVENIKGIGDLSAKRISAVLARYNLRLGMYRADFTKQPILPLDAEYKAQEEHMQASLLPHTETPPAPVVDVQRSKKHDMRKQYVLGCERDTDDPFNNGGPIIVEQMLGKSTLFDVIERSKFMKRYGRMAIFKLTYVGTPEECSAMLFNDDE